MPKKIAEDNAGREDLDVDNMDPHMDDIDDPGEDEDMRRAKEADEAGGADDDEDDAPPKAKAKPKAKAPPKKKAAKDEDDEEDEDEDEEDEEDDEEEDEGDDEEEAPAAKRNVPYNRFKNINDRRRAAEARVQELEASLSKVSSTQSDAQKKALDEVTNRINGLYEDVEKARLAGDTKEAARLQRELDGERDKLSMRQSTQIAIQHALKVQDTTAYNAMTEELAAIDSRFDSESDDFDEALVAEVNSLVSSFERDNERLTTALRRAVKYATGEDLLGPKRLQREVPKTPLKKETDKRKNLDAAKRIPDDIDDTRGEKSRPLKDIRALIRSGDIDKLKESELDALAENLAGGDTRSTRGGSYADKSSPRPRRKS